MRSPRSRSLLLLVAIAGWSPAHADGLDDVFGPREVAVGEAMRGGATGATAIGLNPAGLPLNRELVFEGGFGYRAADSASLVGISACDSTNVAPGCFFYNYLSTSPELSGMTAKRRIHVGGLALSRQFVPRVMVGTTTKFYDFDSTMDSEPDVRGIAFDVGTTIRFTDMINLGLVANNLYASKPTPQFPRALGGGVQMRPLPTMTLSFDMRWKLEGEQQSVRYGGGMEYFLRLGGNGVPLRIGGVRDTNTNTNFVSGGLGFSTMKWGLDVGARRELTGSHETLILASMRIWGPRMAAPSLSGQPGFDSN